MSGDEHHQNERQAILSRLLDAVKQCQVRFGGRSELATDNDSRVSCLCAAWESALHHGLRKSNSALSALKQMTEKAGFGKVSDLLSDIKKLDSEPVFWNYVKEHLSKHESQRFLTLQLVTTDCGRGRAWLRASLNEHSLERYMHMIIESDVLLAQYYEDWAFLRDGERNSMLPNMAAGLGSILFAITIDRPELNKGLTSVNSIHIQNSAEPVEETPVIDEEPKPVIASHVSPASAKKRDRKKKKKLPNVVSFDNDETVGTVITRSGSTSSAGAGLPLPESATAALSQAQGLRESGEGALDENVFTTDSSSSSPQSKNRAAIDSLSSLVKERTEVAETNGDSLRRTSFPAFQKAYQAAAPSPVPSSASDVVSKSSVSSSTDLDQDYTFMAPVGEDGLVVDSDMVALNADGAPINRQGHSLSISSATTDFGEMQSASLGLRLAQQSIVNNDVGSPTSMARSPDEMSHGDLKQAVVHMMLRKESVEEQSKKMESMLQREMDISSTLRAELEELKLHYAAQHEMDSSQIVALQKENELLKHQLKKYVNAVQMLRTENASKEEALGIHLEERQPSIPPAKTMIDYSHEASEYERKLIQVAEMHGELMEFNDGLQRQLKNKDALLRQMREELIQVRGPLPHDRRVSSADGQEMESFMLQHPLINIWIPSAFLRGSAGNAHHVYQVYVRINDEEWNVYRRYSQFHDIHTRLKKVYPIIGKFEFPPKKSIGKRDAKLVEKRRRVLQTYLRNVINIMLDKNQSLASNVSKNRLVSYLPFFNDKADEDKKTRRVNKQVSQPAPPAAAAAAQGAMGGATSSPQRSLSQPHH